MKVFLDVSVLTLATYVTGIQRVTREVALRLLDDAGLEVILLHYHAREDCYHRIDAARFQDYYRRRLGKKERMITRTRVELSQIGQGSVFFDLDAAWMSRMKRSYLLPVLKRQGAVVIAHIYDIISIRYPQYCLQRGVYNFMDFLGAHLKYADALIVNTKATAQDLEKLGQEIGCRVPPCHVVPLGADFGGADGAAPAPGSERRPSAGWEPITAGGCQAEADPDLDEQQVPPELAQAVEGAPYLLMVGTIEPRKNHKMLLDAYDMGLCKMGYHVVFAGYMGWNMEDFQERLERHPDYGKGVFHFAGLTDAEITYLYRHARFLVFASYAEGFGLPIIESILRGTPVLAADIPVSREVAGDCCVWFPQDTPDEICRLVKHYEEREEEYRALKERMRGYRSATWEECAEGMKNVITGTTLA